MTQKQGEEERVYSAYTSNIAVHHKGSWRQELMQRPRRDAAYWLASPGLLSLLSYRTQDHQPRDGTTHNGLGPPPLITNRANALQLGLMEAFPQLRLFSLITPACVKLTHKTSQHKCLLWFFFFCDNSMSLLVLVHLRLSLLVGLLATAELSVFAIALPLCFA